MRTIFILAFFLLGCAKEKSIPKQELLWGWAGSPDSPQTKPFDYFYMNWAARASNKAIQSKNKELMKKTCNEAAALNSKSNLISLLTYNSFNFGCFISCGYYNEKESKIKLSDIFLVSCASEGNGDIPLEIATLRNQLYESLKIEYTACKSIAIPDSNIEGSEWKECECTVYTHIPGGRKSIWEQCIELEKKFESKR
jgi:hypothetical protein